MFKLQQTATASIDRDALLHNYQVIQEIAPQSRVLAVLKANAYGHGLVRIAKALPHADAFGVARIDEALELRQGGVVKPIVLLEGFFASEHLPIIAANNLQTIVHNRQQLEALQQAQLQEPIQVWLKVDTGMHRLGIEPQEFAEIYQALQQCPNVQKNIRLMSHLACADDLNNQQTLQQQRLFEQLTGHINCEKTLANSAAICAWPECHYQWVRPGLMLYGIDPRISEQAHQIDLQPVMTLHSSLIAIRHVKAGESIGYGAAWQVEKDTCIGVVAIGYGDGYPRHAANGTPVLVNGREVPLVGRVSMDMITVDLGCNAEDQIGDYVELWGKNLNVNRVAHHATTIAYELLCNISRRVKIDVL
ncbi:alanine racemase [Thalassotalea sp. HSM 43]|uniref:alanine racemase n=1 Tax=Thalassotalea sp. HSM 43 TaxID=2552945 RepID=UPI0010809AB8|nr:alanine racemase [Thalassotalea sp. HSM 43]QBY03838.1 alanine racemase [Thalassotalea sp. HSM 43]